MNLITDVDILDEAKDCFLTFASEVLTDRAIPSAEDGLLSSQRKILWTMEDVMKMDSKAKTKKCNAIVGYTLATSYFHGNIACYGVLRKMSQKFLMRYPLIIGQGQLGTQESNDMFASDRYTEAKPSVYADLMMENYQKNVVPTKETYNGEYMEPVILPAIFPNAICNGRQAIGISMSHNSAPHNLGEACDAIAATIDKGSALTVDELLTYMPGPDFPLGNVVMNSRDVRAAFATGNSSVSLKIRGDYEIDGQTIIFTSIPYRTYRNKIREQIEKNIDIFDEIIDDFNDESNIGNNKLVFHVKAGVDPEVAVEKLFKLTDLQTTLSYNMNYIVNGTPKMCSMMQLIEYYIAHQEKVVINTFKFDYEKAKARVHILEGLIAAVDKIDAVINIIRGSENKNEAKARLMDFLSIDNTQAIAILDMKLGKLTKIDKEDLLVELNEKHQIMDKCEKIINDKDARMAYIKSLVIQLKEKYGDPRRTKLLNVEIAKEKKEKPVFIPKDCVVIINKSYDVKRVDVKNFRPKKRNSVGTKTNGEIVIFSQKTTTADSLMVFTSKGKMYRVSVDAIPEGTNSNSGISLKTLIKFDNDEVPMAFTTLTRDTDNKFILFATKKGIIKKVCCEEYDKTKRTGVVAINLREGDSVADVTFINDEPIILITRNGMTIRFKSSDLPISSRTAQGVKGMNVAEKDYVIAALPIIDPNNHLAIVTKDNYGKRINLIELTTQNRGGKGVSCSKHPIAGAAITASEDDNILINGEEASIVIKTRNLPVVSRTSSGNLMLKNDMEIISMSKI